jgi:uncharacterized protein YndB with AHSA1/START domain
MDQPLGDLTRVGDRWRLTFTRTLAHPQAKVWRAITEPEHLAVWFPDRIEGEMRTGARLRFVADMHEDFEGEMVAFDPPSVMEITWGRDSIRIELEPDGAGTVLRLIDTFDEQGKAARDGSGWHECLARLITDLDGETPGPWGAEWQALLVRYQAHLGPEASTIGPPEGWEEYAEQQQGS